MTWDVALRLGRVSNLPTVWTNMLAGIVLAGGQILDLRTLPLMLALSLFYIGGMFLNDAFDAGIDAVERPERPIPSGQIGGRTVFALGFGMLAAGILVLLWLGLGAADGPGIRPALAGAALAAAIVFYDWHHKGNVLSPVVMGVCRMLIYVTAGLTVAASVPPPLVLGAVLLLSYLVGLTYVAKQENLGQVKNLWPLGFLAAPVVYGVFLSVDQPMAIPFWVAFVAWVCASLWFLRRRRPGDIPRAVIGLLAGISLLDAGLIAGTGALGLAALAAVGALATLALQRLVTGT